MRKSARALVLGTTAVATAVLAFGQPALADPPGNNATIKLDTRVFDDDPNNEPHVGCRFQVDFYGYDQGDYNATVTFSVHPPTGKPTVILTDTVFIGEDAAGGGTDLDATRLYTGFPALLKDYEPTWKVANWNKPAPPKTEEVVRDNPTKGEE